MTVAGMRKNARHIARSIEIYDDYMAKLDSLESKLRQERMQFESEKLSCEVA